MIIIELVGNFLVWLIGDVIGAGIIAALQHDSRPVRDGRVHCAIRAESGRVLDIGTDWSAGICELSPGSMLFVPSLGVVGNRTIPVRELRPSRERSLPPFGLGWNQSAHVEIVTDTGVLVWLIPRRAATPVRQLLFPAGD